MKMHITDVAFFRDWLYEKRMLADSSVYVYCEVVSRFLATNPDLTALESYNNFIISYSIKKRCYHYFSALKAFIEFKIDDTSIKNKLLEGLIRPELRSDIKLERKYLTEDQILNVINGLKDPKHRVIAIIQTLTGVRAGDILRLKRDNIVPEEYNGQPVLKLNITGKGKKRNVIFLHDEVAQEIVMQYIGNVYNHNDYYFLELGKMQNRQGTLDNEFRLIRMNYLWYWDDLKIALQRAGVDRKDFATHDFRRCFARRVWTRYKDIHVLQSLLNHAEPAVTLRYLEQSGMKNVDYHFEMQNNNGG